jgi:PAS domain-containing protein
LARRRRRGAKGDRLPVLTQVRQVRELTIDQASRHYPVDLRAVVTDYSYEQQDLFIQDANRVDVVGFTALSEDAAILEDAVFRRMGAGQAPTPVAVTAQQAFLGTYDAQLVRITGHLLGHAFDPSQQVLLMQDGIVNFKAELDTEANVPGLLSLRDGSILAVTGVCLVQVDANGNTRSFRILLRSSNDIQVVEEPPWWTVRHASEMLGSLGLMTLMVLGWVAILRRRVKTQTEIIRQRLEREAALEEQYRDLFENANDLIQSVDPQGKLL